MRHTVILATAIVLSGCMAYEGIYAPACVAYAGSEIRLADGRYVWSRFTDQVVIDEEGNEIDQFPGFPREGAYVKEGNRITLVADPGIAPATLYLVQENGEVFLYNAADWTALEESGERPACPLKRQPAD